MVPKLTRADPHTHQPGGIEFVVLAPTTMHLARLVPVPGDLRPHIPAVLIAIENAPALNDVLSVPLHSGPVLVEVTYVEPAELYVGAHAEEKYPAWNIYVRSI